MITHWILVADASGAKVYASDALLEDLNLIDDITFSRHQVRHDDSRGHSTAHLPSSGAASAEAEHDPRKLSEERLARAVAETINHADQERRFERLVVVAPPRFLGDFRASLSHPAAKRVVASIHHDWTKLDRRELSVQVRRNLPDMAGLP
jgi:protein required for attachment to host cells